ncbi:MAG: repressor LexA [Clostridiales bacterium]|nr:repressor LexA [Clostridiales bacterium]
MLRYHYTEDNEFGIRLRQARKDAGLTLQSCADLLNSRFGMNINKGSISKYENGIHEPSMSMVHCLSIILNVDKDYLLGKTSSPDEDLGNLNEFEYRMTDSSMEPKYLINDLLIVKRVYEKRSGKFYVFQDANGNLVARQLQLNNGIWVLHALNSDYPDLKLINYQIEGVVIELRRRE